MSDIWAALLVLGVVLDRGDAKHASHDLNLAMLTLGVFVGSAEVIRRANAEVTASAKVALVESIADSTPASEFRQLY